MTSNPVSTQAAQPKPMQVAITGATGFIGSAIVSELLRAGHEVTVLLRPGSNPERLASLEGFATITYSRLLDESTVRTLESQSPEVFIHCAWRGVAGGERNEPFQITDNIPSTLNAVELAAAAGCRQWIGLGSQAEYGNQNRRMDEATPLRPTTLYGKSKLAAGVAALALCEARKLAGAWLRVFSTYGPGDAPHWFIPYVIQEFIAGRAPRLTRCEQRWDYLFVADAARAVAAAANGATSGFFNLGSGSARPLKQVIETIRTELQSPLQPEYGAIAYRPDQVMHLEADITRLTAATGWRPQVSLEEGIRATVAFERRRPAAPRPA
jgi:nucleoside-diphosphate-sugar epimerase